MPKCCPIYTFPFGNALTSDIPYTTEMQANLGAVPKIEAYYYDEMSGEYSHTNGIPGSEAILSEGVIHVDHGGPATGIIKLS